MRRHGADGCNKEGRRAETEGGVKRQEGEGEGDWEPAELFISKFHT